MFRSVSNAHVLTLSHYHTYPFLLSVPLLTVKITPSGCWRTTWCEPTIQVDYETERRGENHKSLVLRSIHKPVRFLHSCHNHISILYSTLTLGSTFQCLMTPHVAPKSVFSQGPGSSMPAPCSSSGSFLWDWVLSSNRGHIPTSMTPHLASQDRFPGGLGFLHTHPSAR